jgi:hypothetical protein
VGKIGSLSQPEGAQEGFSLVSLESAAARQFINN